MEILSPKFPSIRRDETKCNQYKDRTTVAYWNRVVENAWRHQLNSNLEFLASDGDQMLMCRPCGHFYPAGKPGDKTDCARVTRVTPVAPV